MLGACYKRRHGSVVAREVTDTKQKWESESVGTASVRSRTSARAARNSASASIVGSASVTMASKLDSCTARQQQWLNRATTSHPVDDRHAVTRHHSRPLASHTTYPQQFAQGVQDLGGRDVRIG